MHERKQHSNTHAQICQILVDLAMFHTHIPKVPPSSSRIGDCQPSCLSVSLLTNQNSEPGNALANPRSGGWILHNVGGKKIILVVVYYEYDISGVYIFF